MPEFDKYAPYVWTCYGIAAFILIGMLVLSVMRAQTARRKLDAVENSGETPKKAES